MSDLYVCDGCGERVGTITYPAVCNGGYCGKCYMELPLKECTQCHGRGTVLATHPNMQAKGYEK